MFPKSPDLEMAILLVFVYPVLKKSLVLSGCDTQGVGVIGELLTK